MATIASLGYTFLVRPLFNALILLYNIIPPHDLGIAIILLTLLIRLALLPFSHKALKHQRKMTELQPKIKELQEKHKGNVQAQGQATMALYREHGTSPYAGCFPMLIQFPILIALYRVFLGGLSANTLHDLYFFIPSPHNFNTLFLGVLNLSNPSAILAICAGVAQFLQAKTMFSQRSMANIPQNNGPDMQGMMGKQMTYLLPIFIIFISLHLPQLGWFKGTPGLPAALSLYWIVTMLFSFVQQYSINKQYHIP